MNLPSLTRAAYATGFLTFLLALPTLAGTPPDLTVSTTNLGLGAVTSGAGAHADGHIFYAGGITNGKVSAVVKEIDLLTKTVTTVTSLPTPRAGLGLVEQINNSSSGASNHLYAIGGVDGHGHALNIVEVYDFATKVWSQAAPMPTARGYLAVVAGTDGMVYAIGGTDGRQPLATVEVYNPATNTWAEFPHLNTARSHLAATLGPLDIIYAAGGIDVNGNYLNSVEIATVAGNAWGLFIPMNTPRADFGLALAADSFIHAVGGRNSTGALNSIEGFNTTTLVWTVEPETLPTPREKLASVEGLDGSDYVLGGTSAGHGSTIHVVKGKPPALPSHTVVWYFHDVDEAFVNGNRVMDLEPPLTASSIQLSILSGTSWSSFPAVNGTIEAGGTVVLNFPITLGVDLLTTFTLSATDLHGGSSQVLGSTTQLLAVGLFGGTVQIPISTPLTLKNKVLVLTISDVLGLDLNVNWSRFYVTITGVDGTP
jgi:Kelch motif